MYLKIKKIILICVIILGTVKLAGCFELVDSFKDFPIEEFEEFFELKNRDEEEKYIRTGNLDFAKIEDVVIVPCIVDRSDPECRILIYAYSSNGIEGLSLENILLTLEDETILCEQDDFEEWRLMDEREEGKMSRWVIPIEVEVSESWWHHGTNLILSLRVNVKKGTEVIIKDMAYNATIVQYRGPRWQV